MIIHFLSNVIFNWLLDENMYTVEMYETHDVSQICRLWIVAFYAEIMPRIEQILMPRVDHTCTMNHEPELIPWSQCQNRLCHEPCFDRYYECMNHVLLDSMSVWTVFCSIPWFQCQNEPFKRYNNAEMLHLYKLYVKKSFKCSIEKYT